jgi:transcriptional regulator with XRE-family HTH domain
MPITGTDLKVERVRANVTIVSLAARMGLSRQAIWGLERSVAVDAGRVKAYREALEAASAVSETADEATA